MKYFNVTVMERGQKRNELIKADSRIAAIKLAKSKLPASVMVMKAIETSAPLEETISELFSGISKSFKSKIPLNDKISTIRQIAVMTDAGIAINDTLEDVADNTNNKQLKEIYTKMNSDINAGNSMAHAMEPYTEEFGHVALAMTNLEKEPVTFRNLIINWQIYWKISEIIRQNSKRPYVRP